MKVLELLEAKSKVEIHPWAREFVNAIKAFKLDPTPNGAGSSDGQWVPFEKVNRAITELDAAGFKRTGKVTTQIIYKSKESAKKGLTFTFDDEDASGENKVVVNFWDLALTEALGTEKPGDPDQVFGGYNTRYAKKSDGTYVAVFFDDEFDLWRAIQHDEDGEVYDFKDAKGDTEKSKAAVEKWTKNRGYVFESLTEARDPNLSYTEKRTKNVLDKVILELEGKDSAAMSRLTLRYHRLDKAAKLMAEKRNELNAQMKMVAEGLFDAEDAILTRVIETASCTIMLTKAEKAADKEPTKKVDYAAVVGELAALIPDLEGRIKQLTKKYTEVIEAKDTPTQLRVKSKVDEGFIGNVVKWVKGVLADVKNWAADYDARLAAVKNKISKLV